MQAKRGRSAQRYGPSLSLVPFPVLMKGIGKVRVLSCFLVMRFRVRDLTVAAGLGSIAMFSSVPDQPLHALVVYFLGIRIFLGVLLSIPITIRRLQK